MMRWIILTMALTPNRVLAGDVSMGKQKSASCIACHGNVGVSANTFWPNLAGQKDQYLIEQLKAFRDGIRINSLMSPVAKMFTDQDIEDLAAYFNQLKPGRGS